MKLFYWGALPPIRIALPILFGIYIHKGHASREACPCIEVPDMMAAHRLVCTIVKGGGMPYIDFFV